MPFPREPVGLRNLITPVANRDGDIAIVLDLLNRVDVGNGGTGGLVEWPTDKSLLLPALALAIQHFQIHNELPSRDGVVDPNGTTGKELNRHARGAPLPVPPAAITATEVPEKAGDWNNETLDCVVPGTVPGSDTMSATAYWVSFTRRLYRVEGSSIKWFGVAVPYGLSATPSPLLYFTPTPHQGGCHDGQYHAWGNAWDSLFGTYIYWMGAQLAASGAPLVLVIPFYQNAQTHDLGDFNTNWREVVTAVVGAALEANLSRGPVLVRDTYSFDSIYTASFSNGWHAHSAFQEKAVGATSATNYLFDLDGAAAKPPSIHWRPANGVFYDNGPPGRPPNPQGSTYHLGGRWGQLARLHGRYADFRQHWAVNQFMLYHALWQYAT